jgi:hypothetical protein
MVKDDLKKVMKEECGVGEPPASCRASALDAELRLKNPALIQCQIFEWFGKRQTKLAITLTGSLQPSKLKKLRTDQKPP